MWNATRLAVVLASISAVPWSALSPSAAMAAGHDPVAVTLGPDETGLEAVTLSVDRATLSTPEGMSAMHRAIRTAARHVCAAYLGADESTDRIACRTEAMEGAERSLGGQIRISPAELLAMAQ